jgi:DNA-binding GntR family transcriptional regulator
MAVNADGPGTTARTAIPPRPARASTREFVAEYIRERIFNGDYPAYSRVPQDEVAAAVGMSRIPVREALVALEAEGYIATPTNQGAFVNPLSGYDIRCQFELRGVAIGIAARRAAQLENGALTNRLQTIFRSMSRTDDADEFKQLTIEFHGNIMAVGGSPRLSAASSRFHNIVPGNFYAVVPGAIQVSRAGYRVELKAQRTRNLELAMSAAVAASLARADCLIKLLADRGLLADDAEPASMSS